MAAEPAERYTAAAVVLHWAIAVAIIANLLLAQWMQIALGDESLRSAAVGAYQIHKSIGLTILLLSLLRLCLRLIFKPPALPGSMTPWQRWAAHGTHLVFYVLMLGIPLTGWLLVSTQWRDGEPLMVPTLWFGIVEVPHLFGLADAAHAQRAAVYTDAVLAHEVLATTAFVLLALHVAAALKHQWFDGDGLLARMAPWTGPADPPARRWTMRGGFTLLLLAIAAVGLQQLRGAIATPTAAAITSAPDGWPVLPEVSEIAFSGSHAGKPFRGQFSRWQVDARLNAENLALSRIHVTVATASASDGVALHDQSLPGSEWFDVENHPTATYQSTAIRTLGEGRYAIDGELTIKNNTVGVKDLKMSVDGELVRIAGVVALDRAAVDLGMESDASGRWVSKTIDVSVAATFRAPP